MQLVILAWLLSVAAAAPSPCESEMNKIKDLLQVSCEGQGLTALPAGLPPDTGLLLLASNRFQGFSLPTLRPFDQLTELDLSNNSLATLETQAEAPLPALHSLFLSHNALGSLPALRGLPALTRLALGHNGLESLPEGGFKEVSRLQDLQLQGNRLRQLPVEAFRGLSDLRDLDLSDNELEALPAELLSGLTAVEILRLERNRLRRLPEGFFPEENLFAYVYLVGNPWRCDCELVYLREWLNDNEFSVYTRTKVGEKEVTENEPEAVRCQAPAGEKGTPVMHFQAQCRTLGDSDGGGDGGEEEEEDEEEEEGQPSSPLTTPVSFTMAAIITTTVTPHLTSATSVAMIFDPKTTALTPGAPSTTATTPSASTTTTMSSPRFTTGPSTPRSPMSPTTPDETSMTSTTPSAPTTTSTSQPGFTTGHSTTTATTLEPSTTLTPDDPSMTSTTPSAHTTTTTSQPRFTTAHSTSTATTFDPSTTMIPDDSTTTSTIPSAPTTTITSSPRFTTGHSTPRPPATAFDPSTTAPPTSSTLVPRSISASSPETTTGSLTTSVPTTTRLVPPAPTARCLCPATAYHRSPLRQRRPLLTWGGWLSSNCCLLRLVLYLSCLALVALPSLALLCSLCCSHHPQRAPETHLLRYRPLRVEGGPREPWVGGGSSSGRRTFRVCKTFPVGHVSWLLVSLPAKPARPERSQREGRLSCYSVGRGGDALGAVRVRYATASL